MTMRITGMNSGLDTESIIQELVKAKQIKVDDAKKAQTKAEWKQDAWKDLNSKIKGLQTKFVNSMRFSDAYTKKTTKVSDSSVASVITGANAVNCVQSLKVKETAKTAYMTGGKLKDKDGKDVSALTKLSEIKDGIGEGSFTLKAGKKEVNIDITADTTISDVLTQIKKAGLNANFDATQQRFYISAKESGEDNDFSFNFDNENGKAALAALGLTADSGAKKIDGEDALIELNGVDYKSSNNVFEINGLTITAANKGEVTLSTETDTDGIYDMLKNFLKEYNSVINEIDKLYNADSAKGYEPLTDEEKEAMTESQIEEWEQKIKDSLLRRDSNLSSLGTALKGVMSAGIEVNGKTMYLSDFGINTLGYFEADANERNAYHINGDADDETTSGKADALRSMISTDPDTVVAFFSKLSQNLYSKMSDMSKSVDGYRSYGSFYDDKKMKSDYDSYTTKIKDLEQKLADYEDKWYAKFSAMETALAKMQSNANAITGLLGGGS